MAKYMETAEGKASKSILKLENHSDLRLIKIDAPHVTANPSTAGQVHPSTQQYLITAQFEFSLWSDISAETSEFLDQFE